MFSLPRLSKILDRLTPRLHRRKEYTLLDFSKPDSCDGWDTWSDAVHGGASSASFSPDQPFSEDFNRQNAEKNFMTFQGSISTKLPEHDEDFGRTSMIGQRQKLLRVGFAACRKQISWWDRSIREFDALEIIMRSDGRSYNVNIKPYSFGHNDLYQGRLAINKKDINQWVAARLPLNKLLLLGHGKPKLVQRRFDHGEIENIGISVADNIDGDFKLDIKSIKFVAMDLDQNLELENRFE